MYISRWFYKLNKDCLIYFSWVSNIFFALRHVWRRKEIFFSVHLMYGFLILGKFLKGKRNSCKCGLGSLKKTPTESTSATGPGPTSGQLALNLQPNLKGKTYTRLIYRSIQYVIFVYSLGEKKFWSSNFTHALPLYCKICA